MKLHWLLRAFLWALSPGVVENTGGGPVDRGDDFTPTGPDATEPPPDDKAAADAALAAETAAAEAAKAAKEAKAAEKKPPETPADPDADDDADADKAKTKKRIPLDRHEAILSKERDARKALEAQLAQYQQGAKVADINVELTAAEEKIGKLESDYAKLLADGEVEKATKVMADIRRTEREISEAKADMKIAAATATAIETTRYRMSLERVEAAFPALNPDHEDFDAELLGDVADLKTTYERKGMTPTDALQKAVKKLLPTETVKQDDAVTVKPKVGAADAAAAVAAERKKGAVAKTLEATSKQPASLAKAGMDSDKDGGSVSAKDVLKMSYKDFSALSDETLAKMRGDVL